jgi:tetratricopeptide (TPR) repeat protein
MPDFKFMHQLQLLRENENGFNAGGIYREEETNDVWYVKQVSHQEFISETLGKHFYKYFLTLTPEISQFIDLDNPGLIRGSKEIKNLGDFDKFKEQHNETLNGLEEIYVTAALIGDWDTKSDNILVVMAGDKFQAVYIDYGQAMMQLKRDLTLEGLVAYKDINNLHRVVEAIDKILRTPSEQIDEIIDNALAEIAILGDEGIITAFEEVTLIEDLSKEEQTVFFNAQSLYQEGRFEEYKEIMQKLHLSAKNPSSLEELEQFLKHYIHQRKEALGEIREEITFSSAEQCFLQPIENNICIDYSKDYPF